jgi:hypothetical protein
MATAPIHNERMRLAVKLGELMSLARPAGNEAWPMPCGLPEAALDTAPMPEPAHA